MQSSLTFTSELIFGYVLFKPNLSMVYLLVNLSKNQLTFRGQNVKDRGQECFNLVLSITCSRNHLISN